MFPTALVGPDVHEGSEVVSAGRDTCVYPNRIVGEMKCAVGHCGRETGNGCPKIAGRETSVRTISRIKICAGPSLDNSIRSLRILKRARKVGDPILNKECSGGIIEAGNLKIESSYFVGIRKATYIK